MISETELLRNGPPSPVLAALLNDARAWFLDSADHPARHAVADALRERCARLEPAITPQMGWRDSLTLSLLARLSDLIVVYRKTGNLRAVQFLLGRTKLESTVRYLSPLRSAPRYSVAYR
jgi:hypothetical protein